jgi:hypothetical protein
MRIFVNINGPRIMRCTRHFQIYTPATVKLNRKVGIVLLLAGSALLGSGCSGINASQSVSPATFLLPGLLKADPPVTEPNAPLPEVAPTTLVAQAR